MKRTPPSPPTSLPPPKRHYSTPQPPPRLWLDLLPFDLSVRLALHLTHDEPPYRIPQTPSLLALSQVSSKQRDAVLDALSHTLHYPVAHPTPWINLFFPTIRTLICPDIAYPLFKPPLPCSLFSAPNLRHVHLSNRPFLLRAVAAASALHSLSIEFWEEDSSHLLLHTLAKFKALTVLHLECADRVPGDTVCVFRRLFRIAKMRVHFANACPNVQELSLICNCTRNVCRRSLGHVLDVFPKLARLTTNKPIPDAWMQRLASFEWVVLVQPGGAMMRQQLDVATMIGPVIKGLVHRGNNWRQMAGVQYRGMLTGLKACCNLKMLHLVLARGAEGGIPVLSNLESLQLRWFGQGRHASMNWRHEQEVSARPVALLEHYRLTEGFVRRMLGWTPHLKQLCLFQAEISFADIEYALKKTGIQLEVFGCTFTQQMEPPLERVLLILQGVAKYNRGLKRLELEGAEGVTRMGVSSGRKKESGLVAKIHWATHKLRMCVPHLDVDGMLGSIIPWMSQV